MRFYTKYRLVFPSPCFLLNFLEVETLSNLQEVYNMPYERVAYSNSDTTFQSVLCKPEQPGKYPAIITIHGIFGLLDMDILLASRLRDMGYIVLAHDWQSKEDDPSDQNIVKGIRSAVEFLKGLDEVDENRLGLIGVCRGGSIAMIAGAHLNDFHMLVSFYGQSYYPVTDAKKPVSPIRLAEKIEAPILVIHGEADAVFSVQESIDYCRGLKQREKVYENKFYPGAKHGFFLEGHRNYHKEAAEDAWVTMRQFIKKYL
jgi:carboxymethylenebutenolidase